MWREQRVAVYLGTFLMLLFAMGGCQYESSLDGLQCAADEQCPTGARCEAGMCVALPALAELELTPTSPTITLGQQTVLEVTATDEAGDIIEEVDISWHSHDESVATVDGDGRVTAVGLGTALIVASVGNIRAAAALSVSDVAVAEVQIDPQSLHLQVGRQGVLTVVVTDGDGETLSGRNITWSTDNNGVAEVTGQGTVFARGVGSTTITATSEGVSAEAQVTVVERMVSTVEVLPSQLSINAGQQRQIFAQVLNEDGTSLDRQVFWESSDTSVVTVDENGLVNAVYGGLDSETVIVTAAVDGVVGQTEITVLAQEITALAVSPVGVQLEVGQSHDFSAEALANGSPVGVTIDDWSSDDESVATVDAAGQVSAVGEGVTTIYASFGGVTGSALVSVRPASVQAVSISPPEQTIFEGQSATLSVTVDTAPGEVTDRLVAWSSADGDIATVNAAPDGMSASVFGHGSGDVIITAAVDDGEAGTADIEVLSRQIDSVFVSPETLTLKENQTFVMDAIVIGDDGRSLPGEGVTWQVTDPQIAQIDASTGLIEALAEGQTTIEAISQSDSSVVGTAQLTVDPEPVVKVEVDPPYFTLILGDAQQNTQELTVTITTLSGAIEDRAITFESSDIDVAGVDTEGLVQAVDTGVAVITATSEQVVGNSLAMVSHPNVSALSIDQSDVELSVGQTQVLSATVMGGDPSVTNPEIIWWSDNPAVAGIDGDGQVVGIGVGTATITAYYQGAFDTVTVTVDALFADTVEILDDGVPVTSNLELEVGEVIDLEAVVRDQNGDIFEECTPKWESSDESVAIISTSGKVLGRAAGQTTIDVSCDGASDSVIIEVVNIVAESVVMFFDGVPVEPATVYAVEVGASLFFTAQVFDDNDDPVDGCSFQWSSDSPFEASVTNGVVFGHETTPGGGNFVTILVEVTCGPGVDVGPGAEAEVMVDVVDP